MEQALIFCFCSVKEMRNLSIGGKLPADAGTYLGLTEEVWKAELP